ncbi:MAG TPA: hypothetical protein VF414_07670 [Thermoanaerobaculia bacterium]
MYVFEVVIALLLGGAGLAALARRIGSPSSSCGWNSPRNDH